MDNFIHAQTPYTVPDETLVYKSILPQTLPYIMKTFLKFNTKNTRVSGIRGYLEDALYMLTGSTPCIHT